MSSPLALIHLLLLATASSGSNAQILSRRQNAAAANSAASDCPLAGPAFPAPQHLANSSLLSAATAQLDAVLADVSQGLRPNDTAYAVAVFSATEDTTLYESFWTPPIDVGVPAVNGDSIFRLASVSKVFTVLSLLIEIGDGYLNDPVTKYVPELKEAAVGARGGNTTGNGVVYDDIDAVRWEDVTLGNLASHAAGVTRDVTASDLNFVFTADQLVSAGFPVLNASDVPVCEGSFSEQPCTRQQFFTYLLAEHPVFPTSHSPAYSNTAFALLAFALEAITNQPLATTLQSRIFTPLNLSHTAYPSLPATHPNAVIPGGPSAANTTLWTSTLGHDAPGGAVYSSTSDLVRAGIAILRSSLLPPALTRRWLEPVIATASTAVAVGRPWEIEYVADAANNRLVAYAAKTGDVGVYNSIVVLSPEHEVGWVVLAAGGTSAAGVRSALAGAVLEVVMPAVEAQARVEAGVAFNGTYVDAATNSSVTIGVDANAEGRLGLGVAGLVSRSVVWIGQGAEAAATALGSGGDARLYPSGLKTVRETVNGAYTSRLGFRLVTATGNAEGGLDGCAAWGGVGSPTYGSRAFDDWVFELDENGVATALELRALRLRLTRAG